MKLVKTNPTIKKIPFIIDDVMSKDNKKGVKLTPFCSNDK
jgi:hypothetical protein